MADKTDEIREAIETSEDGEETTDDAEPLLTLDEDDGDDE